MDESRSEILAGIQELRAKAAKQLTGNEYYMVVQQLDTLASSPELGGDLAQSFLGLIQSRLNAGSLFRDFNGLKSTVAASAEPSDQKLSAGSGDPEVPSPAETPAEPSSPPPEEPSLPDSPAEPAPSPGPDIPSPPGSPGGPSAPPPEVPRDQDAHPDGHLITPKANSFGTPQATGAISLYNVETGEFVTNSMPEKSAAETFSPLSSEKDAVSAQGGLTTASDAARLLVNRNLTGNAYYQAASIIMAIRNLPQSASVGEVISKPNDFSQALALLREQAGALSGAAREEAESLIGSLQGVVMPQSGTAGGFSAADDTGANTGAETVTESGQTSEPEPAEMPTKVEVNLSDAPDPEPDPGPRTGFDDLAETSWHRVKDVDRTERNPGPSLNGSSAPHPAAAATIPAERPVPDDVTPEIAEPKEPDLSASATTMSQDNGEAFNDGGSESRSSEPSETGRVESAGTDFAIPGNDQSSREPQNGHQTEAFSEATVSAQAEDIANTPADEAVPPEPQALNSDPADTPTPEDKETFTLLQEAQTVIESTAEELVSKTDDAIAAVLPMKEAENAGEADSPPDETRHESDPSSQSQESVSEETTEVKQSDQPARSEYAASGSSSDETIAASPAADNKQTQEPAKAGFFSRLFGLR